MLFRHSLLVLFIILSTPVQAYYPNTLWSSETIPYPVLAVRVASVIDPVQKNILVLSFDRLILYELTAEKQMVKLAEIIASAGEEWIKMGLFDENRDGIFEMIISGVRHERVFSILAKIEEGKFKRVTEVPFYLSIVSWDGEKKVVGQKRVGSDDFFGPLFFYAWEENQLVLKNEVRLPGGLSGKSISLFEVMGVKAQGLDGFFSLEKSGGLTFFEKKERKFVRFWTSGEKYGGSVFYLDRMVRNPLNQVESTRFLIPLGLGDQPAVHEGEAPYPFYAAKNNGYLGQVVGAVPTVKNSQLVRFIWTGHGFEENWNSPRFDGGLSDFIVIDWDGDGKNEILAVLILKQGSLGRSVKKKQSLLIVLKAN